MPQGSRYDENGKLIWKFDICIEFDCHPDVCREMTGGECGGDFTKPPCVFFDEHKSLNIDEGNDV